jgi:hypothetical protein
LLSVGSQSLHRNGERLTWREIFPFLYQCFQANKQAVYVGFALGYDFAQWFKDLPEDRAKMLLTEEGIARRQRRTLTRSGRGRLAPFPVYLDGPKYGWEIDLHAGKRFKLRPRTMAGAINECKCKGERCSCEHAATWLYVCDVFAFYQSSFLVAIDPDTWPEPIVTIKEYEQIKAGKAQRATAELDETMIQYNILENEIMARLMTSLNQGFVRMGIHLRRNQWYGPGQAVSAWLDKINAPTGETIRETVPEKARNAARKSYYGGWFEIFAHGHIPGKTYEYDINSAYPKIISDLPCLLHGKWRFGDGDLHLDRQEEERDRDLTTVRRKLALVRAEVLGADERCGAMLHRGADGRVLRPSNTAGWYWQHELNAARSAGIIDAVRIEEWAQYEACDCPPPLVAIADLYEERLRVGKKTPEGRALRLVFNSAYGKMAQSVGQPKYANPIYASLITAGCRTKILEAIATHPRKTEDLLMVATDGVYFRTPHPTLPISPTTLGLWDTTTKRNLTLFLPGIYWDDETRERIRNGKSPKLKSRGINARDLAASIEQLDRLFHRFADRFVSQVAIDQWPILASNVAFAMTSPKQALARSKWELCGHVTYDTVRELSSDPVTKRFQPEHADDRFLGLELDRGIIRTFPYLKADQLESTPYDRVFGDPSLLFTDDELTPDGGVWDSLREKITK